MAAPGAGTTVTNAGRLMWSLVNSPRKAPVVASYLRILLLPLEQT